MSPQCGLNAIRTDQCEAGTGHLFLVACEAVQSSNIARAEAGGLIGKIDGSVPVPVIEAERVGVGSAAAVVIILARAATPACRENPATLPTPSSKGSSHAGSVCNANTLRPCCGPMAMR